MSNVSRSNQPSKQRRTSRRPSNPLKRLKALLLGNDRARTLELSEDHVLSLLIVRRAREAVFGQDLFSDPAWDILLELYAASLSGRDVTLADLAIAIRAPLPTAARWIAALKERALVELSSDSPVSPNLRISLTAQGSRKMKGLADQWGSAFVSI